MENVAISKILLSTRFRYPSARCFILFLKTATQNFTLPLVILSAPTRNIVNFYDTSFGSLQFYTLNSFDIRKLFYGHETFKSQCNLFRVERRWLSEYSWSESPTQKTGSSVTHYCAQLKKLYQELPQFQSI